MPPGDVQALHDAIDQLMADPSRCAALGRAGRDRARNVFAAGRMIDSMLSVYGEVANEPLCRPREQITAKRLLDLLLSGAGLALSSPLWLVIGGFSAMGSGSVGGGFLLLLIGGGLGYIWYRQIWVPRWKVNVRMRDHRVRHQS